MSENEPLEDLPWSAAEFALQHGMLQRRAPPELRTTAPQPVVFDFINIVSPADSRLSRNQKVIRSRAALKPRSIKQLRGKHNPKRAGTPASSGSNTDTTGAGTPCRVVSRHLGRVTLHDRALGQGRVDPFRTYPVAWQPFIPALVDHHLTHLAPDIRELDQPDQFGAMGMDLEYIKALRDRWWPLSMTSPSLFLVEILFAASHSATLGKALTSPAQLLQLKGQTIQAINASLEVKSESLGPATIGAVISMAGYEILFGDLTTNHIHMVGLQHMVALRGGVDCLGLDGFVKKMLTWLDTLQQLLTGRTAYFPQLSAPRSMSDSTSAPSATIPSNHLDMLTSKYLLYPQMADLLPRLKNLILTLEAKSIDSAARTGHLYLVEELFSVRSMLIAGLLQAECQRTEITDHHERVKFTFNECLRIGSLGVVEALLEAFNAADTREDSNLTESLLQLDLQAVTGIGIKHLVIWALLVSNPLRNNGVDHRRAMTLATLFHELNISEWQQVEAILQEFPFSIHLKPTCFQIFQRVALIKAKTSTFTSSLASSTSQRGGSYFTTTPSVTAGDFTSSLGGSSTSTPAGSSNARSSPSSQVLTPLSATGYHGSLPP